MAVNIAKSFLRILKISFTVTKSFLQSLKIILCVGGTHFLSKNLNTPSPSYS